MFKRFYEIRNTKLIVTSLGSRGHGTFYTLLTFQLKGASFRISLYKNSNFSIQEDIRFYMDSSDSNRFNLNIITFYNFQKTF